MVRDLAEAAIRMVKDERRGDVKEAAEHAAVERIIDVLHPETHPRRKRRGAIRSRRRWARSSATRSARKREPAAAPQPAAQPAPPHESERIRAEARADIERGFYDVRLIEIEVEETPQLPMGMMGGGDGRGWAAPAT
jgi:ATP-dependent HslUV protease ATP-binding subunit HslU